MALITKTEFAPAKINLTLHVTGQRGDGYHLLDSLVVFADIGDSVVIAPWAPDQPELQIIGPQSGALVVADDNLCLRASRSMGGGVAITLTKVLPISSGIGGGSADAAAVLRAMQRIGRVLPSAADILALGADVPVCLQGRAVRMTGIGEGLAPVTLPGAWLVLANPGVTLSTPQVFGTLTRRDYAPIPALPRLRGVAELAAFLAMQRNDLEPAAISLAPLIGTVKAALTAQQGCLVARMSGSGATCFGLFADGLSASAAARALQSQRPDWWVAAGQML
jgi:4-diphosphocytidyl-2-C-methyl-D-erythritol kinase